jgi:hypothetical protein
MKKKETKEQSTTTTKQSMQATDHDGHDDQQGKLNGKEGEPCITEQLDERMA